MSYSTSLFGASFFATLGATLLFAFLAFAFFALVLATPRLFGRAIKRRCACAGSREVLKLLAERERARLEAARYRPEEVDPSRLPMASPELADYARRASASDKD